MRKCKALIISLLLTGSWLHAQDADQRIIDSLLPLLNIPASDTNRVALLNELAYRYEYINPSAGIRYGKAALALADSLHFTKGIAAAHSYIGSNFANKSDYAHALEFEYKALTIYEQLKDLHQQAVLLQNIAIVHHYGDHQEKALEYDYKSLRIYQSLNDAKGIAALYSNMANVFYSMGMNDSVIAYHQKAMDIYVSQNNEEGIGQVLGNMANFYAESKLFPQAMEYYFRAIDKETQLGNQNGIIRNLGNAGETYLDIYEDPAPVPANKYIPATRAGNLQKALEYLEKCVAGAKAQQQYEYVLAFEETLSQAYDYAGRTKDALRTYQDYIAVRDSVLDVEKFNAATRRELDYEYGKREDSIQYQQQLTDMKLSQEKKLRSTQSIFFISGIILVLLFSGFMFNRWRVTQQQKKVIEKEKNRSEGLLLNILPQEVAEELKEKGTADAKYFDHVTVLFTDFKNFTQTSELLSAEELVKEINYCYSAFDTIISRFNIEKIKTIGDSYMCAAGLPVESNTHAVDTVSAALEFQHFMSTYIHDRKAAGLPYFELRLGIHSGPVVAGIVGIKKFAYDIWGDTVNTASRMESSGEPGKVNISGATYALIKDHFNCIYRGKIEAKNKGEIDMYFVNGEW